MRRKMNDSQADSLQTRKSERNVARAAKCATDKGLGKTCDVPGKGKGSKPIAAFLQSSEIKTRQCIYISREVHEKVASSWTMFSVTISDNTVRSTWNRLKTPKK